MSFERTLSRISRPRACGSPSAGCEPTEGNRSRNGAPTESAPYHNCLDHLVMISGYSREPHGETFWDEGNICRVCNKVYTDEETMELWEAEGRQ